jgi:hypothetical protein
MNRAYAWVENASYLRGTRWAIEVTTTMIGICLRKGVMMKRWVKCLVGVLAVLLAGATAQAELKLVANFDGFTGTPDGQACNGVLGATIDTESEATGNVTFQTTSGSVTLSPSGHSSGTLSRAAGVAGINNPIANDETGVAFFRFSMATGNTIRSHVGLIADTGNNPVNATRTADPKTIPAGFRMVESGTGFDLVTLDGATVLKPGLARSRRGFNTNSTVSTRSTNWWCGIPTRCSNRCWASEPRR